MRFARYPAIALLFFALGYWIAPEPSLNVTDDDQLLLYWPNPVENAAHILSGELPALPVGSWDTQIVAGVGAPRSGGPGGAATP